MIIAIDYHGTYSRDPEGFAAFVLLMKGRGHECILVTGIEDNGDWCAKEVRHAIGDTMRIIFAAGAWKRRLVEAMGIHVDIWIEDTPEGVAHLSPSLVAIVDQRTDKAIAVISASCTVGADKA